MYKIYGIPNCDTVQKSLKFLKEKGIDFEFHDYKKLGISKEKLEEWLTQFDWEKLVNKKGTTWKETPENQKATDSASAIKLMLEKTSVIKRPIIETEKIVILGFDKTEYERVFSS